MFRVPPWRGDGPGSLNLWKKWINNNVLTVQDHGRVRVLTFSRPKQLNAMNDLLYDAVAEGLVRAQADSKIAAVNGLGVGIGLTILPYCDRVIMDEGGPDCVLRSSAWA